MSSRRFRLVLRIGLSFIASAYLGLCALFYATSGKQYGPTHLPAPANTTPWIVNGKLFGYIYRRDALATTRVIWLMMGGNGGQAGVPGYVVAPGDSIYLLEYPGFGAREGLPSAETINAAASAAYHELRQRFPGVPVGVMGTSFGSGPASLLAKDPTPPDSIILIVPIARFDLLIAPSAPFLPVRLLLRDNWDNLKALHDYKGPVTIYAAEKDQRIPREDTLLLARSLPNARLIWIPVDHYNTGGVMDSIVKLSL